MQHKSDMFSFGEDKSLKEVDLAINNIKGKLGLINTNVSSNVSVYEGEGNSSSLAKQRVLTKDTPIYQAPVREDTGNFNIPSSTFGFSNSDFTSSNINSNSASSFVLVFAAVIALIAMVSVVTFGILNIINH